MPQSTKQFRMHIGFTAEGKDRWRYYDTLTAAHAVAERVFRRTKIMLTIEANPNHKAEA